MDTGKGVRKRKNCFRHLSDVDVDVDVGVGVACRVVGVGADPV